MPAAIPRTILQPLLNRGRHPSRRHLQMAASPVLREEAADRMPAQACKYLQEKITKLVNEIKQVKETMESEIAQVKETMDNEITQVKETMENEITQVKETMENEITQVKETMEKEIKEVKETMETMKQTMDKEINRRVKEEITTLMIDVNQKLKILEKDSATK